MAYIKPTIINFNLILFFKNIINITNIGIKGLNTVDTETLVPKVFLNTKLNISNIGHIAININSNFSNNFSEIILFTFCSLIVQIVYNKFYI